MKVAQSCPTLCNPMDYTIHGILQARILELVAFPFSRDLPNPGFKPRSPALLADSFPADPPGKPKITGLGNLSLLQGIFLTQDIHHYALICRWGYWGWERYKWSLGPPSQLLLFSCWVVSDSLRPHESPHAERVTGRKARGLQTEEIGCKCQTFLSLISSRRKQTRDIFFFSIQI